MKKIRDILYWLISEDDKGRSKVKYDLGKTIDKAEEKILNLKLKDLND